MIRTPFLVGIDLGTTNCAIAYVDARRATDASELRVRRFAVPQLLAAREVGTAPVLPSFLYFGTDSEYESGALALPWDAGPRDAVGILARNHGALLPPRQVASVKSWLAHGGIDRAAPILPFGRGPDEPGISPVDATTRYLLHIRDAWNHAMSGGDAELRLQTQQVVLTVPASFDEEARELTAEAATRAGLAEVVLIEEPIAALYAWISRNQRRLAEHVRSGTLILICDVGGGTTDFSLIRATSDSDDLGFERLAIGEHLLLGGDNLDLALAVLVEERLGVETRLSLARRQGLRRQCAAVKEQLLTSTDQPGVEASARVTVLGAGRSVVGGAATVELTRADIVDRLLTGFLPRVEAQDRPARDRRRGLRELGLPYEPDPAITRHLAAFLGGAIAGTRSDELARPDAILFNGGFFTPEIARQRVVDTLAHWFGAAPGVLANEHPESAVAVGAAYYAALRVVPGAARHLLVRAGSSRTYYVALQDGNASPGTIRAITVMPRGTDEGSRLALPERRFRVVTNRPIGFTLYSSTTRDDAHGAVVTLGEDDSLHKHAPLAAVLRYGQRSRQAEVDVTLSVVFTEVGTLELWLEAPDTGHRWRLQFQVRGAPVVDDDSGAETSAGDAVVVSDAAANHGASIIRAVFAADSPPADRRLPETLVADLEAALGFGKHVWPLETLRTFGDVLLEVAPHRARGSAFEARWLNLTGFCLRPGFGAAADAWRIGEIRKVYTAGLTFSKDVQCQVEWLVLWQRVAGGFSTGQQRELAQRIIAALGLGGRKAPRLNPQMERESWRVLATLERLDVPMRVRIGDELALRVRREPRNVSLLWSLGRIGARVPSYGPLDRVVPPDAAERWGTVLLSLRQLPPEGAAAMAQLAALTGDPQRDVGAAQRELTVAKLREAEASPDLIAELTTVCTGDRLAHGTRYFREALPDGLRLSE